MSPHAPHRRSVRSPARPGPAPAGSVRPSTAAVTAAVVVLAVLYPLPHATSWHFFHDAAHLLFSASRPGSAGGLDVYAEHPEFQFGPLSILVALPLAYLPASIGVAAAMVVASLLGVVAVTTIHDTIDRTRPEGHRTSVLAMVLGVVTLVAVWSDVAVRTAHLDDAIALAAAAGAVGAIARRRPWLAVVLLAVAAGAKPWAIMFAPLALAVPGRDALRRLAALAGLVLIGWLPFVVDEPGTVHAAASFKITNAASSALRALGFANATTPSWVRPAQVVFGLAVATVLVRTGRWHAVLMATVAIRLVLDPAVHHYYTAGLVAGVLLWEGIARPHRVPVVTILSAVVCEATSGTPHDAALAGVIRLLFLVALVIVALRTAPASLRGAGAAPGTDRRTAVVPERSRVGHRPLAPRRRARPAVFP